MILIILVTNLLEKQNKNSKLSQKEEIAHINLIDKQQAALLEQIDSSLKQLANDFEDINVKVF
jgi:hypothetical protein